MTNMSLPIHQEILLSSNPKNIYEVLLDSKQFSQCTGGAPAEISREAGGAFSVFGGVVNGRNIELVADRRIVQAWRIKTWPEGEFSIVRFV